MELKLNMNNLLKTSADASAGLLSLAGALEWVNVFLAIPAAIYMCLRIYQWFENRKKGK
jgi:hypothetical protein